MTDVRARPHKAMAFFCLLRLNRSVMVALITGAAAFTARAGVSLGLPVVSGHHGR
jgi:hypothetical protein